MSNFILKEYMDAGTKAWHKMNVRNVDGEVDLLMGCQSEVSFIVFTT